MTTVTPSGRSVTSIRHRLAGTADDSQGGDPLDVGAVAAGHQERDRGGRERVADVVLAVQREAHRRSAGGVVELADEGERGAAALVEDDVGGAHDGPRVVAVLVPTTRAPTRSRPRASPRPGGRRR